MYTAFQMFNWNGFPDKGRVIMSIVIFVVGVILSILISLKDLKDKKVYGWQSLLMMILPSFVVLLVGVVFVNAISIVTGLALMACLFLVWNLNGEMKYSRIGNADIDLLSSTVVNIIILPILSFALYGNAAFAWYNTFSILVEVLLETLLLTLVLSIPVLFYYKKKYGRKQAFKMNMGIIFAFIPQLLTGLIIALGGF